MSLVFFFLRKAPMSLLCLPSEDEIGVVGVSSVPDSAKKSKYKIITQNESSEKRGKLKGTIPQITLNR